MGERVKYRPSDIVAVPGEEVTFERVTKVYREESGKKTLTVLEPDFYVKLAAYIAGLERRAQEAAAKDPTDAKTMLLHDELRKIRKKREQIVHYRERKIALLAATAASGSEVEERGMTSEELAMFRSLADVLRETRDRTLGRASTKADEPERAAAPAGPSFARLSSVEPVGANAPAPKEDLVVVHILEDIPPFAGIDVTYRLRREDVVSLPRALGKVLVDRGKARIVESGGG